MDYRGTLNLPATSFPMRANAPQREPELLARWNALGVYERMLAQRSDAPLFVLHDGPPYANGNMHMGHVLNRVLKDIVVKYKHLAGHRTPYVPGWDCHGLPIELQVEKEVGRAKKAELPVVEVRRLCDAYARRFVDIQREEVRRLGVVGDWDHPYLTLAPDYEAQEIRELGKLASSGSLYRRKKPVYWCASCETALAEAEVEYEEKRSPSIHVRFPLALPGADARAAQPVSVALLAAAADDASRAVLRRYDASRISMVAWTTTPWTLPANLALAIHPELAYVGLQVGGELLIVAEGLAEPFLAAVGLAEDAGAPRAGFVTAALEGVELHHPWLDRRVPVVLGEHVTLESGTGVVHTAPGHGQEDYEIGLRYGLDVYSPVDARGRFTRDVPDLEGKRIFDADRDVLERLRAAGTLVAEAPFTHSYPHCWRCKKPLFFRATEQWFVSMAANELRAETLAAIDRVRWIPPWGRDRIHGMIESRPDWCISRQRSWGVPIVAVYCERCEHPHLSKELAEHVAAIVEREGSNAWFARPAAELVPDGFRCERCAATEFRKETDILDVWFDSGVSHAAVLERRAGLRAPADLYLEGSDQHRGWFHTSLLTSVATRGRAPYEACLTHGFILDGQGRKMSKSGGNAIAPDAVLKDLGADVLRLWVAAEDYRGDVRLSKEILGHLVEAYRRLRNTARFLLGNLGDFDPRRDAVFYRELPELERWALDRLARVEQRAREAYDAYEFHTVYHLLNNFCAVDLSALYLDVVKDRAYCSAPDDPQRRAAQTVMYETVRALAGMLAPILTFLAEDVWRALPGAAQDDSVLLSGFPAPRPEWLDDALAARFERLLAVRAAVTKALEAERQAGRIGHSLEARVELAPSPELRELLRERDAFLPELFIVSQVELVPGPLPESPLLAGLGIAVAPAAGEKCARCWSYRLDVGRVAAYPGACRRCADVLARIGYAVAS
ncbi:MAG: isoleucine--tRNA ligase [Thermodesulfobacteriota bacterium]